MATKSASSKATTTEYAVHKTRGLAYARPDENAEWQEVDIKSVGDLASMERTNHARIGDFWFTVYRGGAS